MLFGDDAWMIWWFYNALFSVGFLLLLPRFLLRMRRRGGYARDFHHRFGRYRPELLAAFSEEARVWVHAVSVGELYVALKMMDEWRAVQSDVRFVVSVTTSTGYTLARKHLDPRDVAIYFPVDFPPVMRRVLDAIRPQAILLVEVELWPNLIRLARERDVPVFLVNGRLSDRSFRRYQKVRMITRHLLPMVDIFCMQSTIDADRVIALGAPPDKVRVTGSAKYDIAADTESGEGEVAVEMLRLAGFTPEQPILLGGSTWPGEEEALLDVYKGLKTRYRNLSLILAPRHVERVPEILDLLKKSARSFVRRSTLNPGGTPRSAPVDVLLLDTTGELRQFYRHADVIFIGKSLTQHGGQNILEPAAFAKPVVVGPNMENFKSIMADFLAAGAVVQIETLQGLRRAVDDLLANPDKREAMGLSAARVIREQQGALKRTLDAVLPVCTLLPDE